MRRVLLFALLLALPGLAVAQGVRYYPSGQNLYQLGKPTSEAIRFYPSFITSDPLSTLLDGLVSYWPLDEESGTRNDVVGTNHLTDNNTVGFDTGKNGNAASFVAANSEWLYRNSVHVTQPLTMSGWARPVAIDAVYEFWFGAMGTWASQVGLQVYRYYTALVVSATDASGSLVQATSSHSLAAGEWVHVVIWVDDSDKKAYISVNNGTPVASPAMAGALLDASLTLQIGANKDSGYPSTGQLDEVAIWSRVLSEEERAELYAMGAGKFYPFE